MNLLVTDSSVLIDLERADLVSAAFTLPCSFAVPDILYANELASAGGPALLDLGLRVEPLESSEMSTGLALRRARPGLSVPAAFGLVLAEARGWAVLSVDDLVHHEAAARGIECCGLLWMFDELEKSGSCPLALLAAGLTTLNTAKRCRLSARDVAARLGRYRAE
ncbi:MAG: hypothetical protein AB7E24_01760 [Novosphingobium sp.]|jgi:hypothetical protein